MLVATLALAGTEAASQRELRLYAGIAAYSICVATATSSEAERVSANRSAQRYLYDTTDTAEVYVDKLAYTAQAVAEMRTSSAELRPYGGIVVSTSVEPTAFAPEAELAISEPEAQLYYGVFSADDMLAHVAPYSVSQVAERVRVVR